MHNKTKFNKTKKLYSTVMFTTFPLDIYTLIIKWSQICISCKIKLFIMVINYNYGTLNLLWL